MKNRAIGEFKIQVEAYKTCDAAQHKFPKIIDIILLFLIFYIYSYYFFLFVL